MPIQIVQEACDCAGFPHVAVFHKTGGILLKSFNVMTMLLSMWVKHTTGVFHTRADEGEVGLIFNTFWARIEIKSDETKGPVSLPYNVLYTKAPIQIRRQFDSQVRMMRVSKGTPFIMY